MSGSADLDAQLELQVAQHLLDGALDLISGDLRAGVRQGQGEGHALLALAEVCTAVNIEQLDFRDERAGFLDGLLDLAAGNSLIADQCQIALDRCIGAEGLITCLLYTSPSPRDRG